MSIQDIWIGLRIRPPLHFNKIVMICVLILFKRTKFSMIGELKTRLELAVV